MSTDPPRISNAMNKTRSRWALDDGKLTMSYKTAFWTQKFLEGSKTRYELVIHLPEQAAKQYYLYAMICRADVGFKKERNKPTGPLTAFKCQCGAFLHSDEEVYCNICWPTFTIQWIARTFRSDLHATLALTDGKRKDNYWTEVDRLLIPSTWQCHSGGEEVAPVASQSTSMGVGSSPVGVDSAKSCLKRKADGPVSYGSSVATPSPRKITSGTSKPLRSSSLRNIMYPVAAPPRAGNIAVVKPHETKKKELDSNHTLDVSHAPALAEWTRTKEARTILPLRNGTLSKTPLHSVPPRKRTSVETPLEPLRTAVNPPVPVRQDVVVPERQMTFGQLDAIPQETIQSPDREGEQATSRVSRVRTLTLEASIVTFQTDIQIVSTRNYRREPSPLMSVEELERVWEAWERGEEAELEES